MNENLDNEEIYEEGLDEQQVNNQNKNQSKSNLVRDYIKDNKNNKSADRQKVDNAIDGTGSNILRSLGVPKGMANKAVKSNGGPLSPTNRPENKWLNNKARNAIANRLPKDNNDLPKDNGFKNNALNNLNKINTAKNIAQADKKELAKEASKELAKNAAKKAFKTGTKAVGKAIISNPYVMGAILGVILILVLILLISSSGVGAEFQPLYEYREMDNVTFSDEQKKFFDKLQKLEEDYKECGATINNKLILATVFYGKDINQIYSSENEYVGDSVDSETGEVTEESDEDVGQYKKRLNKLVKNMVSGSKISGSCSYDEQKYFDYLKKEDGYIDKYLSEFINYDGDVEAQKEAIIEEIKYKINLYDYLMDEKDECTISGGDNCSYNVDGQTVSNIKVQLLYCEKKAAKTSVIKEEELIDFEKYILGVVYQENGNAPTEGLKAQAIATRSFSLSRGKALGYPKTADGLHLGKLEQIDGQWILPIRSCTGDQVYCDPDNGCHSDVKGGEINKGPSPRAATVYSGYDPSATWSREPIPQDSPIRQAVAETVGQVVVKNGEIYNTDFLNSTQQEWNSVANAGGDYYAALQQSYGTDTEITSNCTSSSIGLGVPGSTSKPLDEVSITSKYGYRTHPVSGKENVFHDGVDLIASEGSKVYSVADGVVVKVQEITTGYGKNIIIGHAKKDDGSYEYYTLYAHLSKIHVKEGQQVNGGQEIAASGKTGTVTGAHLHFEVRDSNNNHIDPNPTLGMSSSSSSSATSSSTGARASEDIYYNQHDYPQPFCEGYTNTYPCGMASHNDKSTVATSGCGITALAMTAATLNNDPSITPDRIASWICDDPTRKANYRIEGQGTNRAFFTASETQSEYKVTITPIDKEKPKDEIMSEVIDALKNNKMIIASLKDARLNYHMIEKHNHKDPGLEVWGTEGGHYLVLSSINEEGKIKVLDSASEQRTGYYDQSTIKTNFIGKINSGIYIVEGTGAGTGNSCSAANYSAAGDYANWKQGGDVPWGDDRLGASGTIRGVGCAATSVAIQIARSGVAVSVNPFNPGTFVDWMNKNNGFQGNNIVWQAVSGLAPNFQFVSRDNPVNNSSWSSVAKSYSDAISQGYYIIASVKNSGHWVAIDRVDGDKIYMFDPGQSQTNVMNDVYSLSGVGRFVTYKKTS